jgi:hypothetical protein
MTTSLVFERAAGQLEQIDLDVCERQGHEKSATVTERAVERGAAITDHVRPNANTLTLDGWISNTPITEGGATRGRYQRLANGGATTLQFPTPFDRVRDCHETLSALITDGVLIDVVTSLEIYQQMLLRRYKVDRDATTGSVLPIVLEFVQPRLVETRIVPAPAERRGQARANRGGQAPRVPRSLAVQGLQRLGILR